MKKNISTQLTPAYTTRLIGKVTLIGAEAGRRIETGYAVLEDLLAIHQRS